MVIALLAYFFLYEPEKENEVQPDAVLTAKELSEDWSLINGTFEGLNAGDTVVIRDSIKEIEHFGANTTAYGNVSLTIITFMSTEVTIEGFMEGEVPITDIFGFMMFSGNLTKDYQPGDKVDVELTIANYVIEEKTIELPEWYVDILEATQGIMEYEDIEYPDSSKILHTKE